MTYAKGAYTIVVERLDGGKRMGLYIGEANEYVHTVLKVATFTNEEKAKDFCKWLEYFCLNTPIAREDE